jgi:hypothetical protein
MNTEDDHTKLKVKMKTSQTKFVGVFFLFHLYVTTRTYIHHHFLVGFSLMLFFFAENESEEKKK